MDGRELADACVCDLNPDWPQRSKSSQVGESFPEWTATAKDGQRLIAQAKDVYVYTHALCNMRVSQCDGLLSACPCSLAESFLLANHGPNQPSGSDRVNWGFLQSELPV